MQAIAARRKNRSKYDLFEQPDIHTQDHDFVSQVFDGCNIVLEMVLKHGDLGHLRYLPVRVHIQIASTAVYLIKVSRSNGRSTVLAENFTLLIHCIT